MKWLDDVRDAKQSEWEADDADVKLARVEVRAASDACYVSVVGDVFECRTLSVADKLAGLAMKTGCTGEQLRAALGFPQRGERS